MAMASLAGVLSVQASGASSSAGTGLTIGRAMGRPVPAGFLGLSVEYHGWAEYTGSDPRHVDPVFLQLIRDIAPGQRPVLRIGGDSTDWTWWPVPHMRRPPGVSYALTPDWMSVTRATADALDARMILGVNLEADSRRVAGAEAQAIVSRLGRRAVDAIEIGNEPELYGTFAWYESPSGHGVPGRPRSYDFSDFMHEFSSFAGAMPAVALAGPNIGAANWLANLGPFLSQEPRVKLATIHAYPLKHCSPSQVVTIGQMLADSSSHGLAQTVQPFVDTAHRHGIPIRVDEMNAITCGGYEGVSNSFSSALWVIDSLFEMAKTGVDGVNIHTRPYTINEILGPTHVHGQWAMRVHPEYYGMMMFAQAAPAGSKLLQLSGTQPSGVKVWATRATNGQVRVMLINKNQARPEVLHLRLGSASAPAVEEELRAPSVRATSGVTLGGQTFGASTTTGVLSGQTDDSTVAPSHGAYVVRVPPATATLLTLPASQSAVALTLSEQGAALASALGPTGG
jgi:hypothetical protein